MGNIIEERRRKAWSRAERIIVNTVKRDEIICTPYTDDDISETMQILKYSWERERVKPTKERFAEACPDKAIGAVVANMWRDPFRYWR